MARHVSTTTNERVSALLFKGIPEDEAGRVLTRELRRYIPNLAPLSDKELGRFSAYQQAVYLDGDTPTIGTPIASLNPSFSDTLERILDIPQGDEVYTRASTKENGYRMQLHVGPHGAKQSNGQRGALSQASAFTRQFTRYDLRMFPELSATLAALPVMIGDCELINKRHPHLAGFNRVQLRVPSNAWPKRGELALDNKFLTAYFAKESLFEQGAFEKSTYGKNGKSGKSKNGKTEKIVKPLDDMELTLVFHGMYALSDPSTWRKPRNRQLASLQNVCRLPVDYRRIDRCLDALNDYCHTNKLNARVVERKEITGTTELAAYAREHERNGLEGIVVVQSGTRDEKPCFDYAKTFKIKNYETVDTAVLGLYLIDSKKPLAPANLQAAIVGVYDENKNAYLPLARVNLDPAGVQVKTAGQRERLVQLREEIVSLAKVTKHANAAESRTATLYDVYCQDTATRMIHLAAKTGASLGDVEVMEAMRNAPRGQSFLSLIERYDAIRKTTTMEKPKTQRDKYCVEHAALFNELRAMRSASPRDWMAIVAELAKEKDIKACRYDKPDVILSTKEPLIIETRIFDIKYGLNPLPAGYSGSHGDSFHCQNCYPERIRNDKGTTTDYATLHALAKRHTVVTQEKNASTASQAAS